jgi:NAD(P)-dependent dehydrogenase (short-subunit alcohol dehydrogenase family)
VALEFARRGHHVIATARRRGALARLPVAALDEIDVTDEQSIKDALARSGSVDVLVNAAGAPLVSCPIEAHPMSDLREQLDVNYLGAVRMIQAALPAMRERGSGTIVNISSVSGRVAQPLHGAANASKFALEGMSEALKYETNRFGIRVILVEPGVTRNEPGKVRYSLPERAAQYAGLFAQAEAAEARLASAAPSQTPEMVAGRVADAVESADPPFRLLLGGDAEMVIGVRTRTTDAQFEAEMRARLGLTW